MSTYISPTELLVIREVQDRTRMGPSNIYRLMALDQFPRPIQQHGSKWLAEEVEEFIQRGKEERDRQHGRNGFAPRPDIVSCQVGATNESSSGMKPGTSASQVASTVRMLGPEFCEALRMLKLDIPELYLNPEAWSVSLAVMKVELAPARRTEKAPKSKAKCARLDQ